MLQEPDHPGPRRPTTPGAVFLLAALPIAGLLVFSTVMKFLGKPPKDAEMLQHWALIVGQLSAAGLLLAQRRRPWAWSAAALVFSMFSGVAVFALVNNAKSCGCFGALTVPPAVTLTIDATVVGVSLAMARLAGASVAWISTLCAAIIPMLTGGAIYAKHTTPPEAASWKAGGALAEAMNPGPPKTAAPLQPSAPASPAAQAPAKIDAGFSMTAQQAVLLIPRVADAYLKGAPRPAWLAALADAVAEADPAKATLLFIYDPHCDVCRRFLPAMQAFAADPDAASRPLRVVLLQKADLEAFDIPDWAWPKSPTNLLVTAGRIVHEWGGADTPAPTQINEQLLSRGKAYLDDLASRHTPLTQ